MRTILSLRRHHYLERVGIFLIVVALIAGIIGCAGDGVGPYDLTMAADPEEGGTATDETNESPYEEDTAVSIKAVAAEGYQFDGWTAPAGEFDDANAAETRFYMPARDVIVTAKFRPLQHFEGYGIDVVNIPYIGETVEVGDQFGNWTATVGWGVSFANPVEKTYNGVTEGILDEVCHFMGFGLEGIEPKWWRVTVDNQFGTQELIVYGPIALSVPTGKNSLGEPQGYNCLLNYEVIDPSRIDKHVDLQDQFDLEPEQNVLVTQAKGFGNPAWMKYNRELMEIVNEDDHAVAYGTYNENAFTEKNEIVVSNVFGQWTVNVTEQKEGVLAVPSEKISWEPIEPPLDHFRCYPVAATTFPNPGEVVELKDQFGNWTATVGLGTVFCNPVEKVHDGVATPISNEDGHLMLYMLEDVEPSGEWVVEVNNQFGNQKWTVSGPGALVVPTRKDPHGEPVGLDYFLLYGVTKSPSMDVVVDLTDEFGGGDNNFKMVDPYALLFGNPVQITHKGRVTQIVNPDDHLVFYWMRDEDAPPQMITHTVKLSNLFGQFTLDVQETDEAFLAVPSEKINWYAS